MNLFGFYYFWIIFWVPLTRNNLDRDVSEIVKKHKYRFRVQMRGFAPSIPTSPFLKGLTPKSMNLFQEKVSADAGVLAVFETRKGIEKMPVAPTGKSKLHVFPLRRAKENYFTFLFRTS